MGDGGRRALPAVRVLDLGHGIAGPFAARILGDLGAEVVKVERPGDGDFVRRMPPQVWDRARGEQTSAIFEYLNWNKTSVSLDLDTGEGRDRTLELVEGADVVIASFAPGRLERWGLGIDRIRERAPDCVVVAVSNFGYRGPLADWLATDIVFQAMGGVMQISGVAHREPLKPGLRQSLYIAGLNAAYAALLGVFAARRGGGGTFIDLSIRDVVASQLVMNEPMYAFAGAIQGRRASVQDPFEGKPLAAADGFITLQTNPFTDLGDFARAIGDERLDHPDFETTNGRLANAGRLTCLLERQLAGASCRQKFEELCGAGYLAGFVQTASEQLSCPQLAARDVFHEVPELEGANGPLRFPARLGSFSSLSTEVRLRAPKVDVAGRAGWAPRSEDSSSGPGEAPSAPLAGLRVLDLSSVFAVPYLGGLLADFGAEVIKIEAPHRLDQTRSRFGLLFENVAHEDYWDHAATFQVLNRGKQAIAIDLSREEGQELLKRLVAEADILLDNFTPRVMKKWKTTYEDLRAVNPRLIMLSNTGYGSNGPWSRFKAQGTTLEATMGLTAYSGYVDGPPEKTSQSYPDFLACWTGLIAVMAALLDRERSGEGQWIDLGMYQLGPLVIPEASLLAQSEDGEAERRGNEEAGSLLSGVFEAAGEDQWIAVAIREEGDARRACELLGVDPDAPNLADALREGLVAWAADRASWTAAEELQAVGVPAGPVLDARELLFDEQLRSRRFYEFVEFDRLGMRPLIGRPFGWESSRTSVEVKGAAPRFAESADEILSTVLGMEESTRERLFSEGVLAREPVDSGEAETWDLELMLANGELTEVEENYVAGLAELARSEASAPLDEEYEGSTT